MYQDLGLGGSKIPDIHLRRGWRLPKPTINWSSGKPSVVDQKRARSLEPTHFPLIYNVRSRSRGQAAPITATAAVSGAEPRTFPTVKPDGKAGSGSDREEWREQILSALTHVEGFVELSIRAKVASAQPWHTITVRPVSLKGARHLQVTTFTSRQATATNHSAPSGDGDATAAVVGPLLAAAGLGSVVLRCPQYDLSVQITKRGKGIVHRTIPQGRPSLVHLEPQATLPDSSPSSSSSSSPSPSSFRPPLPSSLSHDRPKDSPIPAHQPHPFLQAIGMQTADGRIRANMQDKFSQVNEFLKLLGHTGVIRDMLAARQHEREQRDQGQAQAQDQNQDQGQVQDRPQGPSTNTTSTSAPAPAPEPPSRRLQILDCGCGSSHLSFGTYHYLNHVLLLPADLTGVDLNAPLMEKANRQAQQLGLRDSASFSVAHIGQYSPPVPPDILLALHACDTATDDALALGVKQGCPLIMAVPCCHAHLHKQLAGQGPSSRPPWSPLLRHGILRQRQLDLLTDSLRAALLRVAGYRTDVVEFVSTEHTPRNLLIRAVKRPGQQGRQPLGAPQQRRRQQVAAAREYLGLRDYWGVTPRLEVLLADEVGPLLAEAAQAPGSAPSDQDTDTEEEEHNEEDDK